MTATAATGTGDPGRRRRAPRTTATVAIALLIALCLAVPADYALLNSRITRVDFPLSEGPGETWVIVGSDSRSELPDGPNVYGSETDAPGQRADVILIIHKQGDTTNVLSLPRDLVAFDAQTERFERLALSWHNGPDSFVRSICGSLGINVSHLIVVSMEGFAAIVDGVGGIDVKIAHPIRDAKAGLDLRSAGRQVLDGTTALALVRSRHPEQQIDGIWTESTLNVGAASRTEWAGRVLKATVSKAKSQLVNPIAMQRIAFSATDHIVTDRDTSMMDLLRASPGSTSIDVLPAEATPGALPLKITDETLETLATAGFEPGQCRVPASNR